MAGHGGQDSSRRVAELLRDSGRLAEVQRDCLRFWEVVGEGDGSDMFGEICRGMFVPRLWYFLVLT